MNSCGSAPITCADIRLNKQSLDMSSLPFVSKVRVDLQAGEDPERLVALDRGTQRAASTKKVENTQRCHQAAAALNRKGAASSCRPCPLPSNSDRP